MSSRTARVRGRGLCTAGPEEQSHENLRLFLRKKGDTSSNFHNQDHESATLEEIVPHLVAFVGGVIDILDKHADTSLLIPRPAQSRTASFSSADRMSSLVEPSYDTLRGLECGTSTRTQPCGLPNLWTSFCPVKGTTMATAAGVYNASTSSTVGSASTSSGSARPR